MAQENTDDEILNKITIHDIARQRSADDLEHKYAAEFKELYVKHCRELMGIEIDEG